VESGVSGLAQPREWDASTIVEAPELAGTQDDELELVVLARGDVLGDAPAEGLSTLIQELGLDPPYRALAVRRGGDTWAVGAVAIEVKELPADIQGDELMLTVNEQGECELVVDERPAVIGIEPLVRLAEGRFETFVLRAARLQDRLWEVRIDPL
jgi:hypothetical protein